MDGFTEAMKWLFLGIILLVPFAVGFATTKADGTAGWIIFALCAVPLGWFALFSESMRQSTSSEGLDAYWGFLPILCLIGGRVAGSYSA